MDVRVEFYAGYKGEESPRRVIVESRSLAVAAVIGRERSREVGSGRVRESFLCRLETGGVIRLERFDDGPWSGAWRPDEAARAAGPGSGKRSEK